MKTSTRRTFLAAGTLVALLVVSVTVYAAATSDVKFTGDITTTRVSGYAGDKVTLKTTGEYSPAISIAWWEVADQPGQVKARFRHMNTGDIKDATWDNTSYERSKKRVAAVGANDYIYKVQVCTNDKKDTSKNVVKGMRVWVRTLKHGPPLSLTGQNSAIEDTRNHCKKWHAAVACPVGQLASAVVVHTSGGVSVLTGLALECRPLINIQEAKTIPSGGKRR